MTKTINLGPEVYVTDPCYSAPIWCQIKLENVLPGRWIVSMIYDEANGTDRNAELYLIHEDHQKHGGLKFRFLDNICVDSGQAGIFDAASYRDDSTVGTMEVPVSDFTINNNESGERWYEAMCKFTLTNEGWGSYDTGVVSRSNDDGSYPVYGAEVDGKIVGLQLSFIDQSPEDDDWDSDNEFLDEF